MAKSTSQFADVLTGLSKLSAKDLAKLAAVLDNGNGATPAPKKAAKALITVRISDPEEQAEYHTVATIWKIKGEDYERPMVGIRDYEDLVSLIEDLQVAELELRPEEDEDEDES